MPSGFSSNVPATFYAWTQGWVPWASAFGPETARVPQCGRGACGGRTRRQGNSWADLKGVTDRVCARDHVAPAHREETEERRRHRGRRARAGADREEGGRTGGSEQRRRPGRGRRGALRLLALAPGGAHFSEAGKACRTRGPHSRPLCHCPLAGHPPGGGLELVSATRHLR